MHRMHRAALAVVAGALFAAPAAHAAAPAAGSPSDPAAKKFVDAISVDKMVRHQQALQDIADANGGTREVFSQGYRDSVEYVKNTLTAAGYEPKINMFNFPFWKETAPPALSLQQREAVHAGHRGDDRDRRTWTSSRWRTRRDRPAERAGRARRLVDRPGSKVSTSGCEDSDYARST